MQLVFNGILITIVMATTIYAALVMLAPWDKPPGREKPPVKKESGNE